MKDEAGMTEGDDINKQNRVPDLRQTQSGANKMDRQRCRDGRKVKHLGLRT